LLLLLLNDNNDNNNNNDIDNDRDNNEKQQQQQNISKNVYESTQEPFFNTDIYSSNFVNYKYGWMNKEIKYNNLLDL
jgi:hypothetical protein